MKRKARIRTLCGWIEVPADLRLADVVAFCDSGDPDKPRRRLRWSRALKSLELV